jgi:undecaprenyl-diphosphatase
MSFFDATILGIIQGITEFLPISSSAHLIIVRDFFKITSENSLAFDAVLQLATTLAVILYFFKDLVAIFNFKNKNFKLLYSLIIATIPAVIFGMLFEDFIDQYFRSMQAIVFGLVIGSVLFFVAESYAARITLENKKSFSLKSSLYVGLFQILAFIPGFSRSGSTISGGLILGINREEAVRFSFLLSIPILLGSGLKKLFDLGSTSSIDSSLILASVVAFVVGLLSIHFLIKFLRNHTLVSFAVYRLALAVLILLLFIV